MIEPFTLTVEDRSISGILHLPAEAKFPCLIACHGLFSSKDSDKFIAIDRYFTQRGFAVLRFDFNGCGQSSGSLAATTVTRRLKDLKEVVRFAKTHPLLQPEFALLGSSLGGYLSLLHAAGDPAICALSIWATPISLHNARQNLPQEDLALLNEDFFSDARQYDLSEVLPRIDTVQILHGEKDSIVPLEHAEKIHRGVKSPKVMKILPGADHALTRAADRNKAIRLSFSWLQKYLKH